MKLKETISNAMYCQTIIYLDYQIIDVQIQSQPAKNHNYDNHQFSYYELYSIRCVIDYGF